MIRRARWLLAVTALAACRGVSAHDVPVAAFANPHPVHLRRPPAAPLSAMALLGRAVFHDPSLSRSGRLACASCHRDDNAYGPVGATAAHLAGVTTDANPDRAVPGLRYLLRTTNFSIGPDESAEQVDIAQLAAQAGGTRRSIKTAGTPALTPAMVPQGGLFWDGRANTLQDQAFGPLFNPAEMGNRDVADAAIRLRRATYARQFAAIFGAGILHDSARLVDEAMFAVARYQVEDASFHPFDSRYDAYLEGRATLTAAQWRGLQAFDDPHRGNCAACHLDRPDADGAPPRFTDEQYEALAVPRNDSLRRNRDSAYHDLGVCGPTRTDLAAQTGYCGMFRTPSLRNVATRTTFFHNGVYRTLAQVLRFYNLRDVQPTAIYGAGGRFDDVPRMYWRNIDTADGPFGRRRGPAMSNLDMADIVAFLATLNDAVP